MKNSMIYLALAGLITFTSCESFLDREPVSDLSPENYFQDKADMEAWNAGIYEGFQDALQKGQALFGDVRSDNVTSTGYQNNEIYMNALMSNNGDAKWESFYYTITRCNTGIAKYPTIPSILEAEYAPYVGQCYGMRAYMYFWATRVWGRLPLVTEEWGGSLDNIYVGRSSLEEVKAQILSDITEAIRYFTISDPGSKYYLGEDAMRALLVEVYMWYGDYQEALDASEYFVGHNSLELVQGEEEWKRIFTNPESSKEVIFSMAWDYETDGALGGWPQLLGASNTNNGYRMTEEIFNEFVDRLYSGEGSDARLWNTVDTVKIYYDSGRVPLTYASYFSNSCAAVNKCIKYSGVDPDREFDSANQCYKRYYLVQDNSSCEVDLVMMRMGNIMLLRAEALNKLGRGSEALDVVNQVRSRVGYMRDAKMDISNVNDMNEVESLILEERQLELWGEGQRWFDLMRTGRLIDVMDPIYSSRQEDAGVAVTGFGDEGRRYWPIYAGEFESNLALTGDQNPPYSER